jgi:hypothetical protein
MRSNSFSSLVLFAIVSANASLASAASPLTYTVVAPSQTSYSVVAPATSPAPAAPKATTSYAPVTYSPVSIAPPVVKPAVAVDAPPATFAPSNEPLAPTSYLASYRANAFEALMQAVSIDSQAGNKPLTAEEINLFRDASSGHAEHWTMAEAVLVASGVADRNERQRYMAQLDQIAEDARVATAKAKTPRAKAKQLIMFLLKGPMSAGYVSDQFNMKALLDTQHFNCVSSAVLFMIVAHRLNMEVAAVQRPGHIFARIPGFDVETTSGGVYPSEKRTERITKQLADEKEDFGAAYSAERPFHETNDFGALTSMYYDTGVDQDKAKNYGDAVVSYLKAACLDATNPNLGLHLNSTLQSWFKVSLKNHQLAQAASIARLSGQIARDPSAASAMFAQLNGGQSRQLASR